MKQDSRETGMMADRQVVSRQTGCVETDRLCRDRQVVERQTGCVDRNEAGQQRERYDGRQTGCRDRQV